ncbi:MAG: nuclease [Rhodospirillaceae bacterium]|nr:nuclease [Rhodospirillaceae bacterium]
MIAKFLATLAIPLVVPVMQAGVVGPAEVLDGITMQVGKSVVRLYGLKAPSADQTCRLEGEVIPCGEEAKAALENLLGDSEVKCTTKGTDNKKRTLATCKADGIDLNKGMVESGWAKADTHETKMFADYEAKPKAAGIGLWQNNLMVRLH